jgi:hypothetical protein
MTLRQRRIVVKLTFGDPQRNLGSSFLQVVRFDAGGMRMFVSVPTSDYAMVGISKE